MKVLRIFFSLIVIISLLTGVAYSKEKFKEGRKLHHKKHMKWWMNPRIIKELELTAEQKKQANKLKSDAQKKMIRLGADLSLKKIDLGDAMREDVPDEAIVTKLVNEIADLTGEIYKTSMLDMFAGNKILTPAQKERLKTLMIKKPGKKKDKKDKEAKRKEKDRKRKEKERREREKK